MTAYSSDLLAQRRPMWDAMSDLFLDTETRWYVPRIARVAAATPWSLDELDHVFWVEVFPLAIENMLQVAGDWAMLALPEPELIERATIGTMPSRLRAKHGWMVDSTWSACRALVDVLRDEPAADWPILVIAWDALGHRYFESPEAELLFPIGGKLAEVRAAGRSPDAEWARYEPIARTMLHGHESAPPRAARVARELSA